MPLTLIKEEITKSQLNAIEAYADKLFAKLGIDIEFTRHFLDRVNDERNKKPITVAELIGMFKRLYKKHGKPLSKVDTDFDAVVKDFNNDINVPFAINVTPDDIEMHAKTVMRKKDFKTSTPVYTLEQLKKLVKEVMIEELLDENYADGKVKGKSRPGRVKKSGASCKGSVTDLRAKAKKYGGEKGKMYHWCANMKAGKKK